MDAKLTVKNLSGLGLTTYEAKIYLVLLRKQQMTAAEIAQVAAVPRSRVYDSLRLLESKNLCQAVSGKIKLYSAIDPSNILETLYKMETDKTNLKIKEYQAKIQNEEQRLVEKYNQAKNLVDQLAPIYQENRKNDNDIDFIEIIKDHGQLRKRVVDLYASVKTEILSFCLAMPEVPPEMIAEQLKEERKVISKGVYWAAIYEIPKNIEQLKKFKEYIYEVAELGEHVRVIKEVPLQMFLIDRKTVLFQLENPVSLTPVTTSSVIQHSRLAKCFKTLFDTTWPKAKEKEELDEIISEIE